MTSLDQYLEGIQTAFETHRPATSKNIQKILTGKVVRIDSKNVVVDVGLKEEGNIPLSEFRDKGKQIEIKIGDEVTIYRAVSEDGHSAIFSRSRALKEMAWTELEQAYTTKSILDGVIIEYTGGGYTVEILNAPVFLPEKQLEAPVQNPKSVLGKHIKVRIIKLDRKKSMVTVSQKHALETDEEIAQEVFTGIVTSIENDKAIITFKDVQYTLLARDYVWANTPDLTTQLHADQELRVKLLNAHTKLVSHKHLFTDPWFESIQQAKLDVGSSMQGKFTRMDDTTALFSLDTSPPIDAIIANYSGSELTAGEKYILCIKEIDKRKNSIIVELISSEDKN